MLSSKSVQRMFVCLVLFLPAITGLSDAGQSSSTLCAPTAHAVVIYAPESNLERREIGDTSRNGNLCTFAESRCNVLNYLADSNNELRPVQERRILYLGLADYEASGELNSP
jgi:hypothetical protein